MGMGCTDSCKGGVTGLLYSSVTLPITRRAAHEATGTELQCRLQKNVSIEAIPIHDTLSEQRGKYDVGAGYVCGVEVRAI